MTVDGGSSRPKGLTRAVNEVLQASPSALWRSQAVCVGVSQNRYKLSGWRIATVMRSPSSSSRYLNVAAGL